MSRISKPRAMQIAKKVEKWNTRYGISVRLVERDDYGRFIDNNPLVSPIKP